jgi:hypothetical protein
MPTVFHTGPYRFFFYFSDRNEPPHIHVEREDKIVKFWLDPIRLQRSRGLSRREVRRIQRIVEDNHVRLMEAWNAYFSD